MAATALSAVCAAAALAGDGDGILDTSLVSRATGAAGVGGDSGSFDSAISVDGRYTAFESDADNLDGDSNDAVRDIFVRDAVTGTTTFVSRATTAAGVAGDGNSFDPAISADGRYVAFLSDADNLDGDSNDSFSDIFVRDTVANMTTLVSRATTAGGAAGNGGSTDPSISPDGGHVAFQSFATNLSGDDGDMINDIFVRDLEANTTAFVSRGTGNPGPAGNNNSALPSISTDGRYIAFESFATNLAASNDMMVRGLRARHGDQHDEADQPRRRSRRRPWRRPVHQSVDLGGWPLRRLRLGCRQLGDRLRRHGDRRLRARHRRRTRRRW